MSEDQPSVNSESTDRAQKFQLKLMDAVRPLNSALEIEHAASRVLGDELQVDRTFYVEIDGEDWIIAENYVRGGASKFIARGRVADSGWAGTVLQKGEVVASADLRNEPHLTATGNKGFLADDAVGVLCVPLMNDGRWSAALCLQHMSPRAWTESEIKLAVETAKLTWAAVESARAKSAVRRGEERQTMLLQLSDAIRTIGDPVKIQELSAELLGEHLNANQVHYGEVMGEYVVIERGWGKGLPAMVGRFHFQDFGKRLHDGYRAGRTMVSYDTARDASISDAERKVLAEARIGAFVAVPLVKEGRWVGIFAVHSAGPRTWTETEVNLVQDVAERTWAAVERARAERALAASESRFRQFAEASSDVLWIRDAASLKLEYLSPAFESIYGVPSAEVMGKGTEPWASLVVPDDREKALAYLQDVCMGTPVSHEFRIQRSSDDSFRWIRDTVFPLFDERGNVQRIAGIAADVTESKQLTEHQSILLAELQHRVRNILAMLRSVITRSRSTASSVGEYVKLLEGRLMAMARTQTLLTRAGNVQVDLASLIRNELSAQAPNESRFELSGPDVSVSPKAAEVLTLAVHELTTNALKYGAFSTNAGMLTVSWRIISAGGPWISLDWKEEGAPPRTVKLRRGFGTELIERRIPYELSGKSWLSVGPGGARCHIEFPLQRGESVLETDAPVRTSVWGGSIDMSGEPDLSGERIMILEDNFYLANDIARALTGAGAEVIGSFAKEREARQFLKSIRPSAAVLDINLGTGPAFDVARVLAGNGIPFIFVTGYDEDMIPREFAEVARLQKPVELRQMIRTLTAHLGRSRG